MGLYQGYISKTKIIKKKNTKSYGVSGDFFCFCHESEEGWERRGGKGEGV